jgi:uncharacterized protein
MASAGAYFDTSVLVKRYVNEPGSTRARELLRRLSVVSSALAPIEAISAIRRRLRVGEVDEREARAMIRRLANDRGGWQLINVEPTILARAELLVRDVTLRTLDAIHVASALVVVEGMARRVPFVTADANQRAAAQRFHLEVVWVE